MSLQQESLLTHFFDSQHAAVPLLADVSILVTYANDSQDPAVHALLAHSFDAQAPAVQVVTSLDLEARTASEHVFSAHSFAAHWFEPHWFAAHAFDAQVEAASTFASQVLPVQAFEAMTLSEHLPLPHSC